MTKPSVVFIVFYIIFTISGMSCDVNNECKGLEEACSKDSDCCLQKCRFSFILFGSYCTNKNSIIDSIKSNFQSKSQYGMCSYSKPSDEEKSVHIYKSYGINAAHPILPKGTKVEITINDKTVLVTINDSPSFLNGTIMELSKEAAKVLDIEKEGVVPCKINIPLVENNKYLQAVKFVLPYALVLLLIKLIF